VDQRLAGVDHGRRRTARRCSNSHSAGGAVQRAWRVELSSGGW
jgi:hypothetical protein